ncbi:MAG: gluconolactonase [Acidobacteria bacterium]|nr:MAG: gluconolactonase [Acidobacteriota bacterium]
MKLKATLLVVFYILSMAKWQGQAQDQQAPTDMVAPAIAGVVAGGTKVQLVKDGFKNTDGVVAMPDGSALFWDNDPVSVIYKVDNSGNASPFLEHMRGTQGLGLDSKGRLIAVEHAPAAIAVIYPPGSEAVLASKFEGKPFNDPNDLVISTKGGIYFSVSNDHEVYYISPAGKVMLVLKDTVESRLNGLQLSPNEKTLYVTSQSLEQAVDLSTTQKQDGESLLAFDVQPDGTLRNRRVLAKYERMNQRPEKSPIRRGGDGLAIDSKGRIYAATAAGVQIFSPQGEHLGTIPVPRNPASLDFAGPDKKTLYIAARQGLYKVQMEAQGFKGRAK